MVVACKPDRFISFREGGILARGVWRRGGNEPGSLAGAREGTGRRRSGRLLDGRGGSAWRLFLVTARHSRDFCVTASGSFEFQGLLRHKAFQGA